MMRRWMALGPALAGAIFGAGWWFWVDAVVCSHVKVPVWQYMPGIAASFAALMFNCVRREDLQDYSPYSSYGDDNGCRPRMWLFIAYVISFVSLAGSVGFLIQNSLTPDGPTAWTGVAGVLECFLVLVSGLVFWTSRSTGSGSDYY